MVILEAICGAFVPGRAPAPVPGRIPTFVIGRAPTFAPGRLRGLDLPVFAAGRAGWWAAGLAGAAGLGAGPLGFVWAPHASVEELIRTQRIVDLFSMPLLSMRKILTIDDSPESNFCKFTIQNVRELEIP
jgi:hypothetical protein